VDLLGIPAQYLVVRESGATEWVRQSLLGEWTASFRRVRFEMKYQRDQLRLRNPVVDCPELLLGAETQFEDPAPLDFYTLVADKLNGRQLFGALSYGGVLKREFCFLTLCQTFITKLDDLIRPDG
jgi:hypothetical protein